MTLYAPPSIDPRSWTLLSDIDCEADEACRRDLESALLPEERVYLLGESPGGTINRVTFGPTCWRFINTTDAEVLVLYSSRREGKTTAAIARLIRLAQHRTSPLRAMVVRDTWTNLRRTVIQTLIDGAASGWWDADFKEAQTECWLNGNQVHLLLTGMDQPADASKFQSLGLGCVWIEEPAPAADLAGGVPVDVFAMAVSSLSQEDGSVTPSVMVTMNPPDEDHWPLWHGTPVLTPTGWVKIGDLRIGDHVIAADGTATEVTGVYPRGAHPLYRVRFSDNTSVLATDEHPWGITTKWGRSHAATRGDRPPVRVVTTGQIRARLNTQCRRFRWAIPLVDPVQLPPQPVPLDPYVLGALLGDGGLTTDQVKFCSADPEVLAEVRAGLPLGTYLRHLRNYDYVVLSVGGQHTPNPVNRAIKMLGLVGHTARTKFIPDVYLWNTPEIRLALLRGLLDTDGHASPDGNSVSFASISGRLIEGVEFLVRSLGGITRRRASTPVGPRRPNACYLLGIVLPEGIQPFRLSRKNSRLTPKTMRHRARRYVVGCDAAGEGEAVCIAVAHPDKLFVCDQFVVTHNTVQLVDNLIARSDPKMRVKTFWVPPGENQHVSQAYRDRMRIGLEVANRGDLVRRLAEGKLGSVKVGEPVTPEFNEERHVAKEALEVRRNFPTYRFFDLWHSPAIVWAQQTPLGYLHVLGCIQGENMGVEELIATHIIPWERQYGLTVPRSSDPFSGGPLTSGTRARPIRIIIDPSGKAGDQSSTERSAAKVIEKMLGATCEYGPVAWSARRDSVKALLARTIRGRPQVVIDPEALPLIRALRGGWRYPKTSSGQIGRLPIKDINCTRSSTEMLTVEGWRTHDRLAAGQDVYAYDLRRDRLRRVPLLAVHRFNEHQELLRFHSPQFDIAVTPKHRLVLGHPWAKSVRLVEAREVTASDRILRAAPEQSQKRPWYTNDFVRACAWVFAEGSRRAGGAWHVVQSVTANAEYCEELDALFTRLGGWRVHDRDIRGFGPGSVMRVWRISGEMADAIAAVLPDKIPSGAFIARLTGAQRRLFLYETIRGDGTWGGEPLPPPSAFQRSREFFVRAGNPVVTMKSPAAIDALQALATLGGLRTTVNPCRWASGGGWQLVVSTRTRWSNIAKLEVRHEEAELVWCPQTPLGTWVARDNGRVWISGNSHSGDAFAYGAAVLYPVEEQVRAAIRTPAPTVMEHVARARSFMGV